MTRVPATRPNQPPRHLAQRRSRSHSRHARRRSRRHHRGPHHATHPQRSRHRYDPPNGRSQPSAPAWPSAPPQRRRALPNKPGGSARYSSRPGLRDSAPHAARRNFGCRLRHVSRNGNNPDRASPNTAGRHSRCASSRESRNRSSSAPQTPAPDAARQPPPRKPAREIRALLQPLLLDLVAAILDAVDTDTELALPDIPDLTPLACDHASRAPALPLIT